MTEQSIEIRDETADDIGEIGDVTAVAFATMEVSDQTEQFIIEALIEEGLSRLKKLGARGCCLVGHPQYYRKFGFENVEGLVFEGVPQEVFFALSFDGHLPQGGVIFHEAFKASG